jgi:hypothetical protein
VKEIIIAILNEYKENLEGYSYYGKVYGVSEDDFEEVAEKIEQKLASLKVKEDQV